MKMKILRQFFRTSASVNKLYKLVLIKAEGKKSRNNRHSSPVSVVLQILPVSSRLMNELD